MHETTHAQPHAGLATNPAEIPNATCINANMRVSAPLKEVEIIFFFIYSCFVTCKGKDNPQTMQFF